MNSRTLTTIATQFADHKHPLTGASTLKPKPAARYIDVTTLQICDDPLPAARSAPINKYIAIFAKLKPGQCIKCQSDEAGKIAGSLNKWLKAEGKAGSVKSTTRYTTDDLGRVWWLPADKAAK